MPDIFIVSTYSFLSHYSFFILNVLAQLFPAGDLKAPKGKRDHYWSRILSYHKYLIMFIMAILKHTLWDFSISISVGINDSYSTSCQ